MFDGTERCQMKQRDSAGIDPRVKYRSRTWLGFVATYLILLVLSAGQGMIYAEYMAFERMPPEYIFGMLGYWALVSAGFILAIALQKRRDFDKPMHQLSTAARQVARGNYSVYLEPRHLPDKADSVDVMFEDFNKMVEALASTDALKDAFIADVSHEVKTPLAVISNHASLLRIDDISVDERKASAEAIIAATGNLSSLVTNILKLNKLENAGILSESAPYDLAEQLADVALAFTDAIEEKGIDFAVELEDRAIVVADRGMLEIVWSNLLSNALKFTPQGGRITLTQTSEEGTITVTVRDTGCGMDDATLGRIFDKFYQGDPSHASEGNGLGLALALRVIELNSASIHVTSEPDVGSTFSVTLKAKP
jgi:signal transduction histidine kinase